MGMVTGTISGLGVSIQYAAKNQVDLLTGKTIFPPNGGFDYGTQYKTQAKPGDQLVHYGPIGNSKHLTTPDTNPELLSLPPSNNLELNKFIVDYPFNMTGGTAAPWFNQIGGGTQYMTTVPIWWLLDKGYISKPKK